MNNQGTAIYCKCYDAKRMHYKILGSITAEGYLEVMRKNKYDGQHGTAAITQIKVTEFIISCNNCNFKKEFKISQAVNLPAQYESL